jgi:hypothetical protein
MGLRDDIQKDIASAFDTDLADAVKSCSYDTVTSSYNATTGENQETRVTYLTRGVWDKVAKARLQDANIKPTDAEVTILQNELSVKPDTNGYLVLSGESYLVLTVEADPADATWVLVARKGDE